MSNGKAYNMRLASRLAAVMVLRQQVLLRMCENEQYLQVLCLFMVLNYTSKPLNTRSHASRGNAVPFTQEPGWPGGRFVSDGEWWYMHRCENRKENPCIKDGTLCMPPIKDERQNTMVTPAGLVADYAYDAAGQLLSVDNNINGTATARRDYHYDAAGNRDEISINGRTPSIYEYTRLNRLKNADHPAVEESWFHDEYYVDDWEGNLIASHNNVSQKGFNALHQLVLDETYAYTYDLDGNLKTRTLRSDPAQVTNYLFNAANQLVKVVAPDGSSVEFGYDVAGRRARKTNRGAGGQLLNDRYYSYNGADLETEYYGNGAKHLNYLYGPGIDNALAVNAANSNYYFLKDAQNSVLAITNYQKTVLKRYWYDSYGNIVYESGALPFENTLTYTGREWDTEIGMYYLRARYYDPRPARFISEDPIWQTNLYMYVNDNPLMYVDPLGLYNFVALCYARFKLDRFCIAAETFKADIENSPGFDPIKDEVIIRKFITKGDYVREWNSIAELSNSGDDEKVKRLDSFSHGSGDALYFFPDSMYNEEVGELLDQISFTEDATLTIRACSSGSSMVGKPIAGAFRDSQNVYTEGLPSGADFSKKDDKFYYSFLKEGPLYLNSWDKKMEPENEVLDFLQDVFSDPGADKLPNIKFKKKVD